MTGTATSSRPNSRQPKPPQRARDPHAPLRVGKLLITQDAILGYGSAGTIVFEGSLDGREVAVKRLLRQFYALAQKEIKALIASDAHPNVVRCFSMEEDDGEQSTHARA